MVKKESMKHLLNWQQIESWLHEGSKNYLRCHEIMKHVDSTNNWALDACRNLSVLPAVCLAEQQMAGKGRNGRNWVSPYGKNIYLSLVSVFKCPVAKLAGLSIAIGVELARMLKNHGVEVGLKWPNDVLVDGCKLAGILVETRVKGEGQVCVVMGVGLNYSMKDDDADAIDQQWTDLARALKDNQPPNRNQLAAELINGLVNVCSLFQDSGLHGWLDGWREFDVCDDQMLEVIDGDCRYTGTGAGITETGALRVNVAGVIKIIHSSEVSVRVVA